MSGMIQPPTVEEFSVPADLTIGTRVYLGNFKARVGEKMPWHNIIVRSVQNAVARLQLKATGYKQMLGQMRPAQDASDAELLWGLKNSALVNLRHPLIRNRISRAQESNDFQFFIKLGEALDEQRNGPTLAEILLRDRLALFLVSNWYVQSPTGARESNKMLSLCTLTDAPLLRVCRWALNDKSLTKEGVKAKRQELGLVKLPKEELLFTTFEVIEGRPIVH